MQPVLDLMADGDPAAALRRLEKSPREGDALYQLERGSLLRLAGRYRESSLALETAAEITEDLYTKSLSREAAALATTDRLRPYTPTMHERLLLRHYQALNYLAQGDLEGALVEARRIGALLDQIAESPENEPAREDRIAHLTAGLIHEAAGRSDEALVFYRRLLRNETRSRGADVSATLQPWVSEHAWRIAREIGLDMSGELEEPAGAAEPKSRAPFTVVVFLEEGFVPPREEVRLRVPILRNEADGSDEEACRAAGDRIARARHAEGPFEDGPEIAYWLEVALPAYGRWVDPACGGTVRAGDSVVDAGPVLDTGALARADLERDLPGITARAVARALIKYGAHRQAEKKVGEVGGILVNVLGVATEQAETRTWVSLPRSISLAVLELSGPVESAEVASISDAGREDVRIPLFRPSGLSWAFGFHRIWPASAQATLN